MKANTAFGSLAAGLLARKGEARPAMRPADEELLGWNDHGAASRPRLAFGAPADGRERPLVLRQRDELAARIAAGSAEDLPARKIRSRAKGLDDGKKAAFTLRLDAERHRKLRIACAISGVSAQTIVMQALDDLLDSLPADAGARQD